MSKVISIDPGTSKCGLVVADIIEKKVYEAIVINSKLILNFVPVATKPFVSFGKQEPP